MRPFLTCPGAKKQSAWYLSALVFGAAQEKWRRATYDEALFDVYVEPGCYTGAVGLALMGKVSAADVDHIQWRFSDPAPGVAPTWNWAMYAAEELAAATERVYKEFDDPWRAVSASRQKGTKEFGVYTPEQVEQFLALRAYLTDKFYGVGAATDFTLEDAARFILFNHRCYNGTVRCGSGGGVFGNALLYGRKSARCITTPYGKYPNAPDCPEADWIRGWADRPACVEMRGVDYEEELADATRLAEKGQRVVLFIDPPHLKWETRKPPEESAQDQKRRMATAERRDDAEGKGLRLKGRKPGKRESEVGKDGPEWVAAYTSYTPEGFSVTMKTKLREDVVRFVEAGGLAVVMDHWSAGWWWEETGIFAALPGTGEEGDAAPLGQAGKGNYAAVNSTTHFDKYTSVAAKGELRAIRRDWFGVAGLRRGFHLPVVEWVPREGEDPWLRRRV